ncbi:MAG TPA: SPOR domain-containing protein [Steroidobacteraceae bacterium]
MRASAIACLLLLTTTLCACSPERRDWKSAEAADTIEAYHRFMSRHPQGELAAQARARIAQLTEKQDWERASAANTPLAYRQFLNLYPEGQFSQEARIRIESFQLAAQPVSHSMQRPAPQESGFAIQLGAFSSEASARTAWSRISARFAAELGALHGQTVPGESGGTRVFRLQAPVENEQQARTLCASLKARGQPCVVVLPTR